MFPQATAVSSKLKLFFGKLPNLVGFHILAHLFLKASYVTGYNAPVPTLIWEAYRLPYMCTHVTWTVNYGNVYALEALIGC